MNLTQEQSKAITTDKSLAVIASAGTGKTTVLTSRYLHLVKVTQISVTEILAFTFTEKAAREMKARIVESGALDEATLVQTSISTIHSFLSKLLKRHGHLVGIGPDFEIMPPDAYKLWLADETQQYIKQKLEAGDKVFTRFLKNYGPSYLKKTISDLVNLDLIDIDPAEINILNPEDELISEDLLAFINANRDYQQEFKQNRIASGILTYDDLETFSLKLLRDEPEITNKLSARFRHILVDEFQDIAPHEYEIINLLFNHKLNKLFIVGDPKQSIYSFRHANSQIFLKTADTICQSGGEVIYLTQTFRTPQQLLTVFNAGFPHLLPNNIFKPATTNKSDDNAGVFLIEASAEAESSADKHSLFAKQVALHIEQITLQGAPLQSIAIIANAVTSMQAYAHELRSRGFKVNFETKTDFFDHALPSLLWHILCYTAGDKNRITQIGILRNPLLGFSEHFIDHIAKHENSDLFSGQTLDLFTTTKDREKWTSLCHTLHRSADLSKTLAASELLQTIATTIRPKPDINEEMLLKQFTNLVCSWQITGKERLIEVFALLKKMQTTPIDVALPADDHNAIRMLTVHGAKGLEFDHVFLLPGTRRPPHTGTFLHIKSKGFVFKTHDCEFEKSLKYKLDESATYLKYKDEFEVLQREETRRLIYVALTRTKKCLYFIVDKASKETCAHIKESPFDTNPLKSYNDCLYWFAEVVVASRRGEPRVRPNNMNTHHDTADHHSTSGEPYNTLGEHHNATGEHEVRPYVGTPTFPVISVTQLETFFFCPQKFKIRYLDQVRPIKNTSPFVVKNANPLVPKLSARERGNLFHEILQFYDYQNDNNLDTVIDQALFNQHIGDGDGSIRAQCQLFITNLKRNSFLNSILFANITSQEEIKFSLQLKEFMLAGQIDKIVQWRDDKGIERWLIIDFKTHHALSAEAKDRLMDEFTFQLSCYALAASKALKLDSIETVVLFTHGPDFRVIKHSAERLAGFEATLNQTFLDYLAKMAVNDFPLTIHKGLCSNCGYYAENYCGVQG